MKELIVESWNDSVEIVEREYANDEDWAAGENELNYCRWSIDYNEREETKREKVDDLVKMMNDSENCINCYIHRNWGSASRVNKKELINYIEKNILL